MVGPGERNGMERVKPMSSYQPRVMTNQRGKNVSTWTMERFPLYDWSCYFTSHRYRSSTFSKIKYPTFPEKSHDQGPQDHATRKGQATSSPTHVPLTSLVSPVRAVTWPRPSTEGCPPFTARHACRYPTFLSIYKMACGRVKEHTTSNV